MNKILIGDCLIKLKELEDSSVDSICTDPPYELGFMGKSWDSTGIANNVELWKECLRVLKPGGHLLAFSGTRTYHRMASAIEDAGFEVRDMIEWVYSTGFPKSLNVFKALKKKCECGNMEVYENRTKQMGANSEQEAEYFLRFMQERDLSQTQSSKEKQGEVLQSGLSQQSTHRTVQREEPKESSIRGEERILERGNNLQKTEGELQRSDLPEMSEEVSTDGEERRIYNATQISDGSTPKQTTDENGSGTSRRPQSEQQQYREPCAFCKQWGTQAIRTLGVGTATKPAHEPICMARKPLAEKSVALNVLKYGTGGINIDESRVGTERRIFESGGIKSGAGNYVGNKDHIKSGIRDVSGRFPANLCHDNSEEVRECFPETKSGGGLTKRKNKEAMFDFGQGYEREEISDSGNASRFFKSINIDESRVETSDKYSYPNGAGGNSFSVGDEPNGKRTEPVESNSLGRFPANLLHDNSEEVRECFPEQKSGARSSQHQIGNEEGEMFNHGIYGKYKAKNYDDAPAESGNASRFFKSIIYQAKASKSERNKGLEDFEEVEVRGGGGRVEDGYDLSDPEQVNLRRAATAYGAVKAKKANIHPTVKPIALMEYLIKMVTPKGGIVLDPFAGSGSTLVAAKQNDFNYVGIEMTEEYIPIIEARLNAVKVFHN